MHPKEDYTRFLAVSLAFALAILASFQVYLLREPGRVAAVQQRDTAQAVAAGKALYAKNCTTCHGDNGEGDVGPALNDKTFLSTVGDTTIFSVISSGVPGTKMPSWNQAHGGPLTDEDVRQLVAFLRSWEPAAPDRRATPPVGDPARGKEIYDSVCSVCHGPDGRGAGQVPALNDPEHLAQFDDAWYRQTIADGRPSKGMPTWGTVLSPMQVTDLLALFDQWRKAAPAAGTQTPAGTPPPAATAP